MIWIVLLIALVATFCLLNNLVQTLNNPRGVYEPGLGTTATYEKYQKKKNALAIDRMLYMWVAALFWMIFVCLSN